jgi:hypothetical protein
MMFPNPHNVHTAINMLPGSSRDPEMRRQMVREPGKRGDNGVIMIIVISFIVGLITPFAGKLFGI